jgi:hypothetical protein
MSKDALRQIPFLTICNVDINCHINLIYLSLKEETSECLVRIRLFIYDIIPSCNSIYQII